MGKGTIGGKIVLEGEKEYRNALKNIKTEQAELRSEMKLANAEHKNSQNSMDALTKKYEILTKQIDTQQRKVQTYEKALQTSTEKQKAAADKVDGLKKELQEAEKAMQDMESTSGNTSEAFQEQSGKVEDLKQKLALAEQGLQKAENSTSGLQTQVNNATAELKGMENELQDTEKYMKEASDSTDGCATSIDRFGKKAETGRESMEGLAQVIVAAGITKGLKETADALLLCADAAAEFETSIAKVSTVMDESAISTQTMSKQILTASNEVGKGAGQIAEAAYQAISAGVESASAAKFAGDATKLAVGGFTEAATSVDILTTVLNAYNLETEKSTEISDMLITTQNLGKTTVDQLAGSMGKVIPVAAAYSVEMDNLSSAYAIMTANGIATAETTTYLKAMLNELGDGGSDVAKVLRRETGSSFADLTKQGYSLGDVMEIIGNSVANDKTAFNALWSSAEAGVGALSILGSGSEKYNDVLNQMRKSTGATEEAFKKMSNTTEYAEERMRTSFKNLQIAVGESIKPALKEVYSSTDEMLQGFTEFVEKNPEVVKAVEAVAIGVGLFTAGIIAATVAMKAYAAIQAVAFPVAGVIGLAIGAATVALGAFITMQQEENSELEEQINKTKELAEETDELNKRIQESSDARKSNRNDMEAQAAATKKLTAELISLQKKTALTNEEQKRQKNIVQQLNEVYPNLNLQIDEQTGKLKGNTDALERNVEAQIALAKAEAAKEDLAAIAKEQYEAEKQLAELEAEKLELTEALTEAQERQKEAWEAYNEAAHSGQGITVGVNAALKEANEEVKNATLAVSDMSQKMGETSGTIANLESQYAQTMDYISENEAVAEAAADVGALGDAAEATGGKFAGMSAETIQAMQKMQTELSETIWAQMNIFDEYKEKASISTTKLLENMQSQVDGVRDWSNNIKTLSEKGIDQGLLEKLSKMGPEGAGYVATFVAMTDEELKKANELFKESMSMPDSISEEIMDSFKECGERTVEGFEQGIFDNKEQAAQAAEDLGAEALRAERKALDINSPSGETKKDGEFFVEGITTGISGKKQDALKVIAELTAAMLTECRNGLKTETLIQIGQSMTEGLAQGIKNGKSRVINEVQTMCREAVQAARRELDINSPSKKFEYLGEMSGEGYIGGWQESMANIEEVMERALPDTKRMESASRTGTGTGTERTIYQEIKVYAPMDNPIETAHAFKMAQKEAAREW